MANPRFFGKKDLDTFDRVNKDLKLSTAFPVPFRIGTGRALYPFAIGSNKAPSRAWLNLNIALLKPSKHSSADVDDFLLKSSLPVDPAIEGWIWINSKKNVVKIIFLIILAPLRYVIYIIC